MPARRDTGGSTGREEEEESRILVVVVNVVVVVVCAIQLPGKYVPVPGTTRTRYEYCTLDDSNCEILIFGCTL